MKSKKFYNDAGSPVSEKDQMCKCGHSAAKHVQTGLHPKNGYVCIVRSCTCSSFKFDRIR